jgi:hypothetical protein
MKTIRILCITVLALAAAGCASTMVSDEAIVDRTAFALGLNKGDFAISNRSNEGGSSRYAVRTKKGEDYNCSLGVVPSVVGAQVTDAICTKKGEPAKNPLLR